MIKAYFPGEKIPKGVIFPNQKHTNHIIEIVSGNENLQNCDGIWTRNENFVLGIKTADCAPITFCDQEKFGILHVGWRGFCQNIIEKMQTIFYTSETKIFVGAFLPEFEIQKDECYEAIENKFGKKFLKQTHEKIYFEFQKAISWVLPSAKFDGRSTFDNKEFASWRRDHDMRRNILTIDRN